ncbi:hypothetical protein CUN67_20300 [Pantoea cypripedii]|uniref:Uncharacterized protein n=1 Tax=Pantoea cypripedii TaxID=55209 RepID=A0A6B9GEK2_PANCY|nr:hypothetical protein CUN67_20300 [Pantoea cypripedii]
MNQSSFEGQEEGLANFALPGRRRRSQSGYGQRAGPGSILKYVTRDEHCPGPEWQVSQADIVYNLIGMTT